MAKISFDQISTSENNTTNLKVGFFALKDDGDEAIVRFMHDSTETFDLVTTHPESVDGRYRNINCIRDPREPMENCPLCKNGHKVQQRFYIHLIQYVKDESGNIIPQAKVWERSVAYAVTLKNLIDEYGPLSDSIFKIRRNGRAGSTDTTYAIMYGNPNIYRNEMYPKDTTLFEGYSVVGNAVLDKSFEELTYFVNTGIFNDKAQSPLNKVENNSVPVDRNNNMSNSMQNNVGNTTTAFDNRTIDMDNRSSGTMPRPIRYY